MVRGSDVLFPDYFGEDLFRFLCGRAKHGGGRPKNRVGG